MDDELAEEIETADEGDLADDEGTVVALEGAVDDEDILTAAGFSAL